MTLRELINTKKIRFVIEGGTPEEHQRTVDNLEKQMSNHKDNKTLIAMLRGKARQMDVEEFFKLTKILENNLVDEEESRENTPIYDDHFFHDIMDAEGNTWNWKYEDSSICCMGRHNLDDEVYK